MPHLTAASLRSLAVPAMLGVGLCVAVPAVAIRTAPCGTPRILTMRPDTWLQAFEAGERMGRRCGADLRGLARHAETVDPTLRRHYFEGASHSLQAPPGDPSEAIRTILDTLPIQVHDIMATGLLVARTQELRGEPEPSLAYGRALATRTGVDLQDGIRIGVQRSRGHDLPDALALAGRYPEELHAALSEELGWRAGDEGLAPAALLDLRAQAPDPCAFTHGAVRGSRAPRATVQALWRGCEEMAARAFIWNELKGDPPHAVADLTPEQQARVAQERQRLERHGGVAEVPPWLPTPDGRAPPPSGGELYREAGPTTGGAGDVDGPAMHLDDALDDGEAQTDPFLVP